MAHGTTDSAHVSSKMKAAAWMCVSNQTIDSKALQQEKKARSSDYLLAFYCYLSASAKLEM